METEFLIFCEFFATPHTSPKRERGPVSQSARNIKDPACMQDLRHSSRFLSSSLAHHSSLTLWASVHSLFRARNGLLESGFIVGIDVARIRGDQVFAAYALGFINDDSLGPHAPARWGWDDAIGLLIARRNKHLIQWIMNDFPQLVLGLLLGPFFQYFHGGRRLAIMGISVAPVQGCHLQDMAAILRRDVISCTGPPCPGAPAQ